MQGEETSLSPLEKPSEQVQIVDPGFRLRELRGQDSHSALPSAVLKYPDLQGEHSLASWIASYPASHWHVEDTVWLSQSPVGWQCNVDKSETLLALE